MAFDYKVNLKINYFLANDNVFEGTKTIFHQISHGFHDAEKFHPTRQEIPLEQFKNEIWFQVNHLCNQSSPKLLSTEGLIRFVISFIK